MTQFDKIVNKEVMCDICEEVMLPIYGWGWYEDILACTNYECGAEIIFPTSTEAPLESKVDTENTVELDINKDIRRIKHCIGLLNSMILSGENHSETSSRMVEDALVAIERMERDYEI